MMNTHLKNVCTSDCIYEVIHLVVHVSNHIPILLLSTEEIRGLEIFDSYEKMIQQKVGPYEQSSQVVLSCRAYGGEAFYS